MKKIIMVILLLISIVSCDFLANKTIHVPKMVLQSKTNKKFPITKNFLLAEVVLKNPKVDLKGNRLYIESNYTFSLLKDKSEGKMYMNSEIKYNQSKEQLYLVDLNITKITDANGKEIANSNLENQIKSVFTKYVESFPVFDYAEETKDKTIKVKVKNMYIKDNKFYVQT